MTLFMTLDQCRGVVTFDFDDSFHVDLAFLILYIDFAYIAFWSLVYIILINCGARGQFFSSLASYKQTTFEYL